MKSPASHKIALVSLSAPHYRKRIFELLEEQVGVSYLFGDDQSSIKQLNPSLFKDACVVPLKFLQKKIYRMPGTLSLLKQYDIVIDDMGILCLSSCANLLISKLKRQKVFMCSH